MALLCDDVSHLPGTNLESALYHVYYTLNYNKTYHSTNFYISILYCKFDVRPQPDLCFTYDVAQYAIYYSGKPCYTEEFTPP